MANLNQIINARAAARATGGRFTFASLSRINRSCCRDTREGIIITVGGVRALYHDNDSGARFIPDIYNQG